MGQEKTAEKEINIHAPLLAALAQRNAGKRGAFHMPGHQQGRGQWPPFSRLLAKQGQALDLTELPGLDNLGTPEDCIEKSQTAMARLSGSQEVFYLVNGATAGLEAAVLAMSSPEIPTIMSADCHMAIQQGLILSGSRPLILPCLIDEKWGLPLGVDQEAALTYFNENPGPKAVGGVGRRPGQEKGLWISLNPTYNGVIADFAWEKEMLSRRAPAWAWLVDEAHGAHLPFADETKTPSCLSALYWGADVVVQSAHKMGSGFTQTALLHCNRRELASKLRQGINIMQSSSPSYLLMASLDAWQAYLQTGGRQKLKETEGLARELAYRIRALGGYRLWQDELPASCTADPRKITVSSAELGLDGFALADMLRQRYGIDTEMASDDYVLFIVNLGFDLEQGSYLVKALEEIQKHCGGKGKKSEETKGWQENKRQAAAKKDNKKVLAAMYRPGQKPWQPELTPREAFFSPRQKVRLEEAKGRLAAVPLVPYPPGIPLVFPGMVISGELIEGLTDWLLTGQSCNGLTRVGDQAFVEVLTE